MGESTNKDKNKMKCIKCIYIFRQLIDNLKEVRLLKLIKYNKKLQKKLNLNITNYMDFQKIKIELNTFNAGIKNKCQYLNVPFFIYIWVMTKMKLKKIILQQMKM